MMCYCHEQHIEDPFMLAVKEELGDRFTLNVETAYRALIRFILTKMSNEVRHYQSWDESKLTFKSRRA